MDRQDIYAELNMEREYQDYLWGGHNHDKFHEPESWITYMEHYLDLAKKALSTKHVDDAYPIAMDNMRKVVALGIACMENYGCPTRVAYFVKKENEKDKADL